MSSFGYHNRSCNDTLATTIAAATYGDVVFVICSTYALQQLDLRIRRFQHCSRLIRAARITTGGTATRSLRLGCRS